VHLAAVTVNRLIEEGFPLWEWHPATVHFPIAFLLGGVAFDLYAWWRGRTDWARIGTGLLAAGALCGAVAVITGAIAFFTLPDHTETAHVLMLWHLGLMSGAIVLFSSLVAARSRAAWPGVGVRIAGLLAAAILLVGAYLGGNLVYHQGTGIDPRAFDPEQRDHHDSHHGHEHHHS
jgi:uncharacterized membrane protein